MLIPTPSGMMRTLYTPRDLDTAYEAWGCNCGPAALAAVLGRECEAVRPFLGDFEQRRYANPTHLGNALSALRVRWSRSDVRPSFGLVFIQWGGPWLQLGVPVGAAYRNTHWIAVSGEAVFDVNAGGWVSRADWEDPKDGVAAWLMSHVSRCDGTWKPRSSIQIHTLFPELLEVRHV